MFRLIRLFILLAVAFMAGILFERAQSQDACFDAGGTWNQSGYCITSGGTHD